MYTYNNQLPAAEKRRQPDDELPERLID